MKWIKALFKTLVTALLVFTLLFAGGWLLVQSHRQYRYANRLAQLRDTSRPWQAPKYFIELNPDRQLALKNNRSDVFSLINNVPSLNRLLPAEKHSPLPDMQKTHSRQIRWKVYSRPFEATRDSNKIAIIIVNSGLDGALFEAAAESLPENIAFSFSPYADSLKNKITLARTNGHETYADILFPQDDASERHLGPAANNPEACFKRLHAEKNALGGIVVRGDSQAFFEVIKDAARNGYLIIGSGENIVIPDKKNIVLNAGASIETDFYPENIREKLELAEQLARTNGQVLLLAEPKPAVILALADWIATFDDKNNLELVPPTALIEDY